VYPLPGAVDAPRPEVVVGGLPERSRIITLVATDPPGKLVRGAGGDLDARNEEKEPHWTLEFLTAAARGRGITVGLKAR
jgi:hypothetical protein